VGEVDKLGWGVRCFSAFPPSPSPEAWMPIFDKSKTKSWDEKIYARDVELDGKTIHVIGL